MVNLFHQLHYDIVRYKLAPMIYGDMWYDIHRELRVRVGLKKPLVTRYDLYKAIGFVNGCVLGFGFFGTIYDEGRLYKYLVNVIGLTHDDACRFMFEEIVKDFNSYCDYCETDLTPSDYENLWRCDTTMAMEVCTQCQDMAKREQDEFKDFDYQCDLCLEWCDGWNIEDFNGMFVCNACNGESRRRDRLGRYNQ